MLRTAQTFSACARAADPRTLPAVLTPALHRIAAWLCLMAALVTGVTPAQGFVLCMEPDGCISVEIAAGTDHCVGCEAHVAGGAGSFAPVPATAETDCPCVDFAVPGSTKDQSLQPKAADAPLLRWLAMLPTSVASPLAKTLPLFRVPRVGVPRPSDTLLLIRTVVLLV